MLTFVGATFKLLAGLRCSEELSSNGNALAGLSQLPKKMFCETAET
jgi:hypothetical protein